MLVVNARFAGGLDTDTKDRIRSLAPDDLQVFIESPGLTMWSEEDAANNAILKIIDDGNRHGLEAMVDHVVTIAGMQTYDLRPGETDIIFDMDGDDVSVDVTVRMMVVDLEHTENELLVSGQATILCRKSATDAD